jgi:plastocyanin
MSEILEPGGIARRPLLRPVLATGDQGDHAGDGLGALAAARPEIMVDINNFTFTPTPLQVKASTTVTWVNHDDIPHSIVLSSLNARSHPLDTNDFTARLGQRAHRIGISPGTSRARSISSGINSRSNRFTRSTVEFARCGEC